jgi:lathosterol oxidase
MGLAIKCQTSANAQPTLYGKEVADTLFGFGVVVGAMVAWPLANHKLGYETALQSSLDECVPDLMLAPFVAKESPNYRTAQLAGYMVKMTVGFFAADAYNYWKHRSFHATFLWPFHKVHHSHHNPSAMAGFAIEPLFGFVTFVPIYLFACPSLGLYLPMHWPLLVFYIILNHYLHCGYVIPALERILAPMQIMTSAWHNVHHEKGRVGFNYNAQTFGEMLTVWDRWMGTHVQGHYLYSGSTGPSDKEPKKAT